jgi:regulatory protein SWI5
MLSQQTSSIEQRRKSHRRQNSTPVLEVQHARPLPATLQRTTSQLRGHRRGQSLDQRSSGFKFPEKMTPTLGPIAQDDSMVSLTYTGQHHQQHPLQVAQQHSMAQPGQPDWHIPQHHSHQHQHLQQSQPNLSLDTAHLQHSPEAQPSTPSFEFPQSSHLLPSPQTPQQQHFSPSPQPSQQQFNNNTIPSFNGSCEEAVKKLKESVEAVYGPGSNVYINILPTPVATPQKRTSMAPGSHIDSAPMPLDFSTADGLGLDPTTSAQCFDFQDSPEGSYYSPGAMSPAHSPYYSPQQQAVNIFTEQPQSHPSFDDHPVLSSAQYSSSQTTLADVEPMYSPNPHMSPDQSPRAMSMADLSLDATIEETGISSEEVAALIDHDVNSNTYTCLFEGCGKKGFQRRENVRSHVQTHLGDRPFKCNHCGKTFVRPHDLKRHAKIHSGVKPYQCPCGQEFVRQDALTRHRQRGSCCGAFPDAIPRTPARRGRPRKNKRPDMDDRLDKANRTRRMNQDRDHGYSGSSGSSNSGSGSEAENSPSPQPTTSGAQNFDFAALDTSDMAELANTKQESQNQNENTESFR